MMDILYTKESREYKGNETPEGSYRLDGIDAIGRKTDPGLDGLELIRQVHSPAHIRQVQRISERNGWLAEVQCDRDTFPAAVQAAALAWTAARNGHFACTRPPGHHATPEISKGFCFFNNMAIVTHSLLQEGHRICILDIDGHQGDGTEQIFYASNRVLFISIHQEFVYPNYPAFTSGEEFDPTVKRHGNSIGKGFTYNAPVPAGSGDDVLLEFLQTFVPAIREFAPDYIGISAGFDGYQKDSLLNLKYSQQGYYQLGAAVREIGVKTYGLLEGGYHRDVVECIRALVAGLNGADDPTEQEATLSKEPVLNKFHAYLQLAKEV